MRDHSPQSPSYLADSSMLPKHFDYAELLLDYNRKVNLVSRKSTLADIHFHISHCLQLARKRFVADSIVVDWGSGGGLPCIPLAISFPSVHFIAVESISKKMTAVNTFVEELGLPNVSCRNVRAESFNDPHHYSVSRATAPLQELWSWHRRNDQEMSNDASVDFWRSGLLALKGGNLDSEIKKLKHHHKKVLVESIPIDTVAGIQVDEKYIVVVTRQS